MAARSGSGPRARYQPPIADTPKATYQGNFDAGPVEQGRMSHYPTSPPPLPFAPLPLASESSHPPLEKSAVTPLSAVNSYSEYVSPSKSTPWHRTTKGRAIMIVGALVVVAVIVGVAVGVTQSKNNRSENSGVTTIATSATAIAAVKTNTAATITTTAIITTTATTTTAAMATTTSLGTSPNDGYATYAGSSTSLGTSPNDGYATYAGSSTNLGTSPNDGYATYAGSSTSLSVSPNGGLDSAAR